MDDKSYKEGFYEAKGIILGLLEASLQQCPKEEREILERFIIGPIRSLTIKAIDGLQEEQ